MKAVIVERGNGLPDVGDYVPGGGELWLVERLDGRIQTGSPGEGNWIRAEVSHADWDDCDEDEEFPAEAFVDDDDDDDGIG